MFRSVLLFACLSCVLGGFSSNNRLSLEDEDSLELQWSGPEVLGVDVKSSSELIPGDQLYYWLANLPAMPKQLTYMHFGLYLGAGYVAHWHPDGRSKMMEGEVYLSTWEKYADYPLHETKKGVYRAGYGVNPVTFWARPGGSARMQESDGALASVVRGIASMGDRFRFDPKFVKNCETISFFAKTGFWTQSRQVSLFTGASKFFSMMRSLMGALFGPAKPKKPQEGERDITKGGADLFSLLPSLFPVIMKEVGVTIEEDSHLAGLLTTPEEVIGFCRALTLALHLIDSRHPLKGHERRGRHVEVIRSFIEELETQTTLSFSLQQLMQDAPPVTAYVDPVAFKEEWVENYHAIDDLFERSCTECESDLEPNSLLDSQRDDSPSSFFSPSSLMSPAADTGSVSVMQTSQEVHAGLRRVRRAA